MSLTEEDVPGAKFVFTNIEDHSVLALKRWLYCRGLKQTGRKVELIERCRNHIAAGSSQKVIDSVDKGQWYELKFGQNTGKKYGSENIKTWKPFPSVALPQFFNAGHIYHYFIENKPNLTHLASDDSAPPSDGESEEDEAVGVATSKPFKRGQQYLDSGNISRVEDASSDNEYYIRSAVKSSFRTNVYLVEAILSSNSAHILNAACQCKQSSLGRCSHVMALMLFLKNHVEEKGCMPESCTGRPRQWGHGSSQRDPGPIHSKDYGPRSVRSKRASFDPRSASLFHQTGNVSDEKTHKFLQSLQANNRESETLWQSIIFFKYEDFDYSSEEQAILVFQCQELKNNITSIFGTKTRFCLPGTSNQSFDEKWKYWRRLLLTSSIAKSCLGLTSPNAKTSFLKRHLWGIEDSFTTKAMAYGIKNEETARNEYFNYQKKEYSDVSVDKTGLWMCKDYPLLGCSPDDLVFKNGRYGLLEIKCPYVLRHDSPEDFSIRLSKQQKNSFCLQEKENGLIQLKLNHSYYYQVQMAMQLTGREFCDLVIWTKKGFLIIEVSYDKNFAEDICQKLQILHEKLVSPEYFSMRCVRDLPPFQFS